MKNLTVYNQIFFPVNTQSSTIVYMYKDIPVTSKDLASLNNDNWLTDNIIHVFLSTYDTDYNLFVFPYASINYIIDNGLSRSRTRIVGNICLIHN